jgi:hypothetical protein
MEYKNVIVSLFIAVLLIASFGIGYNVNDSDVKTVVEYKNNTIEVVKEVMVEQTINYLDEAVNEFLSAVEADDEVSILGTYNFDEVSVKKIYDAYTVSVDDDVTIVEFEIKLKFDDENEREINTYNVRVTYEEDEDTIVELI